MNRELTQRFKKLEQHDWVSAGQIRPFLDKVPSTMDNQTGDDAQVMPTIQAWAEEGAGEAPDLVVVTGAANIRAVETLCRALPDDTKIYIIEYDMATAARLFAAMPLEDYIAAGRIRLSFGSSVEMASSRFLLMINMPHAPDIRIFDGGPTDAAAVEFYTAVLNKIRESVHLNVFNIGTMIDRGKLWQHNTIRNIPYLAKNPGIKALENIFKGKPAIVVGAGPSLNRSLDVLRELADRFVIISTGTALRPLRNAGIKPALVVAVDGSHKTLPQFEVPCDDLYLACSALVYPGILPRFKGLFSGALISNPIGQWLNHFGTPKGTLVAAGTVTVTAIDLAAMMGCDPVISVGFDLCFEDDGKTHADHTMYHDSRLDPRKLVRVPGNLQEQVLTTEQFRCYIMLMEEYIKSRPDVRLINATTGGARIQGLEVVSPGQLAGYAADRFDAAGILAAKHGDYHEDLSREIRDELQSVFTHLNDVMARALQAAMLCNQLILMLRMPSAADENQARDYLEQLEEIDAFLTSARDRSLFIDLSLLPIGYRMNARRNELESRYSDAVLVNRRSRELYEQIAGASRWTRDLIKLVIEAMQSPDLLEKDSMETLDNRPAGITASMDEQEPMECLALEEVV
jgi:hypothetical protein